MRDSTGHRPHQGFALISVLVALGILLALLVPFLTSVLLESGYAVNEVSEDKTGVEVRGLRDLELHEAGRGYRSNEIGAEGGTPDWDGRAEYPARLTYPDAFKRPGPRVMRNGGIEDLQRKVHLPTASPLVLGNLLGLATTLVGEHPWDTETITVQDASRFPQESGALLIYGERIDYQAREGNVFSGLRRTSGVSRILPEDCLVLDYRVVKAVTHQFERKGRREYVPYASVAEVQSIGEAPDSPGRFTKPEMDVLLAHCTTYGFNEYAVHWGKPLRVFNGLDPQWNGPIWYLRTDTSMAVGGGAIVRIQSLKDPEQVEYNLVWATQAPRSAVGTINLQSRKRLNILFRPDQKFDPLETVVQPLIPVAVNINTADRDVLVALLENVRMGPLANRDASKEGGVSPRARYGLACDPKMAAALADQLVALREGGADAQEVEDGRGAQPFKGFEDLCKRFFYPRADETTDQAGRQLLTTLVDNWLTGRGSYAEMGTMPVCFASSSLIRYRAAALRTTLAGLEASRGEVVGVASAMPGHGLDLLSYRQRDWWELTRLDRRSPGYLTFPVNLAAIDPGDLGTDPGATFPAFLYHKLYPKAGFNSVRFPSQDRGTIRAGTAIARAEIGQKAKQGKQLIAHESFRFTEHPDGRDLTREGVFDLINVGPRGKGAPGRKGRHPDASFMFTTDATEGMLGRHAMSFWFNLESLGDQCIYDLGADVPERNRINVRLEGPDLVFEVLDEAGLDPNPSDTRTQPERTAARWKVPTTEINLQPKVWSHINLSADGNRPDQMSLFVDGAPRTKPMYVTYLEQEIPEYKNPASDVPPSQDKQRYPEIKVTSTEGFPEMGVLRIGRELFEYTSKDDTTFYCKPVDSMGERKARMSWVEYRESLEQNIDEFGRPTINSTDLKGSPTEDKTPKLARGTAVELYGYAAALYRNRPIPVGTTRLKDSIGAWSFARALIDNPEEIRPAGGNLNVRFSPGKGLTETTDIKEIWLVDPLPNERDAQPPDRSSGAEVIAAGFPPSGGYALLVQAWRRHGNNATNPAQAPSPLITGGVELIQYSKRDGKKLTGVTRGVTLPGTENLLAETNIVSKSGKRRIFVSEWDPLMRHQLNNEVWRWSDLQQYVLYVVPISVPVQDGAALNNPADTGTLEWAQLYPGKGEEWSTEWVRYNLISKESYIVRAHQSAWMSLYYGLCGREVVDSILTQGGGSVLSNLTRRLEFTPPQDDGMQRIGYIDKIEIDYPIIHHGRNTFGFRGDPRSGTSSHAFNSGAEVMPCHRLELDWGKLGALSARVGRNDRVALVGGTKASGQSRPPLEWHTVNWMWQRHNADNYERNQTRSDGVEPERYGPYFFQMIALKAGVQNIFVGPEKREDFLDTRRVDRVVKFPSGELPAAYVEAAYVGGVDPKLGDFKPAKGYVDEITVLGRHAETTLLNIDVDEKAMEIPIRKHTQLYSYGTIGVARDMTQSYPTHGGLLKIDDEIIAYAEYSDGVFKVAEGGRGLLGTEAKPHGDIARVQYLPHVPCAILAGSVSSSTNQLVTKDLGGLPRYGGTVLLGRELLHYTWTIENTTLGMPEWHDPDKEQSDGVGLFRGRYGTVPQDGASGAPVIWFPFRFWDRYHARSDDPALNYYQVSRRETPVYFQSVQWTEENPAPSHLQLKTLVRIDGAGSWSDDPDKVPGLYAFDKGTVDDKPNPLGWQGSSIEVRFATEYRPAAFDPETFLANGWKQAITVKDMIVNFEGQTRILEEQQSAR